MRGEAVGAGREVLPHDELAEREMPERGLWRDGPAVHAFRRLAERRENLVHVDAGIVLRERLDAIDCNPELDSEELDERRVERGVLVKARNRVAFVDVPARHAHGHEQNRRAAFLRVRAFLMPRKESDCEVERVDTALLEVGLCEAMQLLQSATRLVF